MFFSLHNSPATFQMMMDDIFQPEIIEGWLSIYMDDFVIATKNNSHNHDTKVRQVLQKLHDHDLYLKLEKGSFSQQEVEYLGVIIGGGKVQIALVKVNGITEWPTPTTVQEVCSFLGFCNFYHAFIPHENDTFLALKLICSSSPILHAPDWTQHFILETDTSGFVLGAVISQEFSDGIHPIGFYSCSLQPDKKNYDVHNKELAAIIFGFKCGHPFFLGTQHTIEVCTDHKNLQYFHKPQKVTSHQVCWITFLQDFTYTLTYVASHENTIANLLSYCTDLNKGVNIDQPRVLLPPTLFSNIYNANPLINQKIFLKDNPET
jgi:RNase H-like domain found in reverse transcriptase/Reverse transcriptase (RNA-dependent DNA polymerase)